MRLPTGFCERRFALNAGSSCHGHAPEQEASGDQSEHGRRHEGPAGLVVGPSVGSRPGSHSAVVTAVQGSGTGDVGGGALPPSVGPRSRQCGCVSLRPGRSCGPPVRPGPSSPDRAVSVWGAPGPWPGPPAVLPRFGVGCVCCSALAPPSSAADAGAAIARRTAAAAVVALIVALRLIADLLRTGSVARRRPRPQAIIARARRAVPADPSRAPPVRYANVPEPTAHHVEGGTASDRVRAHGAPQH